MKSLWDVESFGVKDDTECTGAGGRGVLGAEEEGKVIFSRSFPDQTKESMYYFAVCWSGKGKDKRERKKKNMRGVVYRLDTKRDMAICSASQRCRMENEQGNT